MVVSSSHGDGRREENVIEMGSSTDGGGSGSPHSNWRPNEEEAKPSLSNEGVDDDTVPLPSDDKPDEEREHHHQIMRMDDGEQHLVIPLGSHEKWYNEDPSGILDQSCSTSQWLDFWT
ncbi:hypothetical protein PIB30_036337 [Stylosanthes scabra]|uniref:Uncharacterized protein n=1 Tax=Stylosanthes scabra TaxID=79078 RepID=A0ABU6VE47_9FABA|nr:hypothetical protein [Stylosanthes scabra]